MNPDQCTAAHLRMNCELKSFKPFTVYEIDLWASCLENDNIQSLSLLTLLFNTFSFNSSIEDTVANVLAENGRSRNFFFVSKIPNIE